MIRQLLYLILLVFMLISFTKIYNVDSASLNDPEVNKEYRKVKSNIVGKEFREQEEIRKRNKEIRENKLKELRNATKEARQRNENDDKVISSTTKAPKVVPKTIKKKGHNPQDKYKREWNVKETEEL